MANTHSLDLESTSSQYASITDAAQTGLDITGDMTVEFWIRPESLPTNANIVSKWNSTSDQRGFSYHIQTGGVIRAYISSDGTNANTTKLSIGSTAIVADVWQHVAIVYDASEGSITQYINGVADTATTGHKTQINNNTAPFCIGFNAADFDYFDGLIDDVRVWNDIRTANEIYNNYRIELVGNESNLVAYWKLNNDYFDETSNNNDLTTSGSPVFSVNIPFRNFINYSLDLEATSSQYSYITDANQVGLDLTTDFTIEAWVKLESAPSTGVAYTIFSKWGGVDNPDMSYTWAYYDQSGTKKMECTYIGTGAYPTTQGIISTDLGSGTWHHIAVVVDISVPSMNFYIDGVEYAATMNPSAATDIVNSTTDVKLGAKSITASSFFDGLMSDVRVWSDKRTAKEIADNYRIRLSGTEANLVANWRLDNNYLDLTTNNNDLAGYASPIFTTDVPNNSRIQFDSQSSSTTTSTTLTYSHICSGTDRALVVAVIGKQASDAITDVTYAGVAMTKVATLASGAGTGSDRYRYLFLLINPKIGENNVVISASSSTFIGGYSVSYTGVRQNSQPDAYTTGTSASATSFTQSLTTAANNCLLVAFCTDSTYNQSNGTSTLTRYPVSGTDVIGLSDSYTTKAIAGSHSLNWTTETATDWGALILSLAPSQNNITLNPSLDGGVQRDSGGGNTWSNYTGWDGESGTGGSTQTDVFPYTNLYGGGDFVLFRAFLLFNCSSIPESAVIRSAKLRLYVHHKYDGDNDTNAKINVFSSTPSSTSSLAVADFDQIGSTKFSDDLDITGVTEATYIEFALNSSGLANITAGGWAKFSLREGHDYNAHAPAVADSSTGIWFNNRNETYKPELVIEYDVRPSLTTSLISFWKLDESSGNAADSVGSNTLANNGTATYSAGKKNNGVALASASSQYLSITDAGQTNLDITGELSISAWFKLTDLPGASAYYSIAGKSDISTASSDSTYGYGLWYDNDSGRRLVFSVRGYGVGNTNLVYSATLDTGVWYHVVATYTPNVIMNLYLNGTLVATSSSSIPARIADPAKDFRIGNLYTTDYFNGMIDEVGVWNRVLSLGEAMYIYNSGNGNFYPFGWSVTKTYTATTTLSGALLNTIHLLKSYGAAIALSCSSIAAIFLSKVLGVTMNITGDLFSKEIRALRMAQINLFAYKLRNEIVIINVTTSLSLYFKGVHGYIREHLLSISLSSLFAYLQNVNRIKAKILDFIESIKPKFFK